MNTEVKNSQLKVCKYAKLAKENYNSLAANNH